MAVSNEGGRMAAPGDGDRLSRARLYSGLVLFVFAATHLINHSLGLVSVEAMDAVRVVRSGLWRSAPGTILLYGSLITHAALALHKFAGQRTWRLSFWPAIQLISGLVIPVFLMRHIIGTRMVNELFSVNDNYGDHVLWILWPDQAWRQAILITLVWVHGCIGLHFWLRMKPWYGSVRWPLFAAAVLAPTMAFAGFSVAARQVRAGGTFVSPLKPEEVEFVYATMSNVLWGFVGVLAAVIGTRLARMVIDRVTARIKVTYGIDKTVINRAGPTLLEISQRHGIPHASVCGGRARCSTCRVRVLDGLEHLHGVSDAERRVLERVGAGANVRLACQLRPSADLSVATLLPATRIGPEDIAMQDRYVWGVEQTVSIMFADIRGFTALSEDRLPFDVVFLLNQFLGQMSGAIEDSGGYVDKFLGDGIMAIFGIESSKEQGARDALRAARSMSGVLSALNRSLASDLPRPLNIGIGVNTGAAILGRVGDAGQASGTRRITALGDTVNTASRLEAAAKELGVQLVISARTARASGYDLGGARTDTIKLRGKANRIRVLIVDQATSMTLQKAARAERTQATAK